MPTISVDIVIITYNRPTGLSKLLESLAKSTNHFQSRIGVIVVNNNSNDKHAALYEKTISEFTAFPIKYLHENRQGSSWARNCGISNSLAEYIAFLDDDEQVDANWLSTLVRNFEDRSLDFLGGPYLPNWEIPPPEWLPSLSGRYRATIGWLQPSDKREPFENFNGSLFGGNCAIRREILVELSGFSTHLGRSSKRLMCGEDDDLYRRLISAGAKGIFDPKLIIYHWIPRTRLTINYHVRWSFWSGASNGIRLREFRENVPYVFSIPRYRISIAAQGILAYIFCILPFSKTNRQVGIIGLLDAAYTMGLIYGLHTWSG